MVTDSLVEAIVTSDIGSFILLKDEVSDINGIARNGMTPLIASIVHRNIGFFTILVDDNRINLEAVDRDGYDPMYHAVRHKYIGAKIVLANKIAKLRQK